MSTRESEQDAAIDPSAAAKIGDLIEIDDRPRVVRLDDLTAADPRWISATYFTTPEVARHLAALQLALTREHGVGVFLIGQYGSGKSHFLAYVAQNLAGGSLVAEPPHVVSVSLLNFASDVTLEQVTSRALGLRADADGDRRVAFQGLATAHPRGVCLILDELSEFLRSKRDRAAFTEDVRFLQFLGEWASANRLFVIAGMQEQIEHTGDLEHGLYRKIKDRYPLRFLLTPSHVRELVRDGILRRRSGYAAATRAIAADVARALPDAEVDPAEIASLYPIHPATLEVLEEVRDCFSQARGAVDFVVTQLLGDTRRGIDPFLERPVGDILTPDRVVDHFRDLLELQPDHLPLAQQLFPYYERHLDRLFDRDAARALARRLIKLLVLDHLSPSGRGLTAERAAAWLLYRVSKIDTAKNVSVLARLLDKIAADGRHVVKRGDRFSLDFGDSDAEVFERRLRREVEVAQAMGDAVLEELAPLLHDRPFNPYALPWRETQPRDVRWHFHDRRVAVYFGADDPPRQSVPTLVVRPLLSPTSHCPGAFSWTPRPLAAETRHFELLALHRLKEERWSAETSRRLHAHIEEKRLALEQEVKAAFVEGRMNDPTGAEVALPGGEVKSFDALIDRAAQTLLRRQFPGFERFAPGHGPLPKEAYRRFAKLCFEDDLTDPSNDDYVNLIREAYLVPMQLMKRRGSALAVASNLEKCELIRLVLPLIEQRPVPRSIYEHLAQPIYGLVPDQVHLLLMVLLAVGELDLVKDGKSYRELYELLPDPLQYDRVEPAKGLPVEAITDLRTLCEGLGVSCPPRWHVLAQRLAVERLRQVGHKVTAEIEPVIFRLEEADEGSALIERLRPIVLPWRTLDTEPDPLRAFELFRHEIENAARFVTRVTDARKLPERIDRVLAEVRRNAHVLSSMPDVARREGWCTDPGPPPELLDIEAAERWVQSATDAYREYQRRYRERHDEYWREVSKHPLLGYAPPAVARSRHVGIDRQVTTLQDLMTRVKSARCQAPVDLSFQATCRCGFDGTRSPCNEWLAQATLLRDEIEEGLRRFFGQEKVREVVRGLEKDGLEGRARTGDYLDRRAPYPNLTDVARFDRALSGVAVTKTLRAADLTSRLAGRTWRRDELLGEVDAYLRAQAPGEVTFRFEEATPTGAPDDEVVRYCVRLCAATGRALPSGLPTEPLARAGVALRPDEVSSQALYRLDQLRLPAPVVEHWLRLIHDGALSPPPAREGESLLLTCARELAFPTEPSTPGELAELTDRLYRGHDTMSAAAGDRWLERLDRLAQTPLPDLPELATLLRDERERSWLLIDALGLPLYAALAAQLGELLGGRRIGSVAFARVPAPTTTDHCYRHLIDAGLTREVVKLDGIDALLHDRAEPFDVMARLAATEVQAGWRKVAKRFAADTPIVVFADHGFRMDRAGRRYQHGGASTLEEVVPVLRLDP